MNQKSAKPDPDPIPLAVAVANAELDDATAKQQVVEAEAVLAAADWDSIFTDWIFDIKNEKYVGKPLMIVATIESITDPWPLIIEEQRTRETVYSITLQDHRGTSIECLTIPHDTFKAEITQSFEKHSYLVFCGTVISVRGTRPRYALFLHKIITRVTPEDIIRVRPEEGDRVAKKFLALTKNESLLSAIKDIIVDELGIKGLDTAKELSKCLDFMILQSISHGMDSNNSMKLHSLVIGPPGVGKKLLTLTAKALNPVTEEVASTSGKITMAGLVGNVTQKGNRRISNPGYMARASSGVICIQDFHEVKQRRRKEIFALLAKVMEDGEVIDSTSALWVHEAITSIHLDTNKYSQVNPTRSYDPFSDINVPINVLSRFDFIIDIPRDIEGRWQVVYEITKGEKVLESYGAPKLEQQWQRDLRRIVAHVRTYFIVGNLSLELSEYILSKIALLKSENEVRFKDSNLLADIITRLAISVQKYVKAIASARLRTTVLKEDVDLAFVFIKEKLAFLAQLDPFVIPDFTKEGRPPTKEERWGLIYTTHKGQEVDGKIVFENVKKLTGRDISRRTITRDLDEHAQKIRHNRWRID